jgi:hypothetical protein
MSLDYTTKFQPVAPATSTAEELTPSASNEYIIPSEPESGAPAQLPERSGRGAKLALKAGAAVLAFMAPAVAHGINNVEAHPSTHVPMHIAGTEVTATIQSGSNVVNITALGQKFTNYSHARLGSKDIGYDVNLDASNITEQNRHWNLDGPTIQELSAQFSNLSAQKHEITEAVAQNTTHNFEVGLAEALAAELTVAGAFLYGRRRLKTFSGDPQKQAAAAEYFRGLKPYAIGAAATVASIPLAHLGYSYFSPNQPEPVIADPALIGTPLEGWEVNGPFKPVIDAALPNVSKFIQQKNDFYDAAEKNFASAFRDKYETTRLEKKDGVVRVIFEDDPQGIDGTQVIVGEAAKAYNADVVLVGGDLNTSGSKIETDVADALYDHAHGIPVGASLGHHDDLATIDIEKEHRFTVSNDTIQKIGPLAVYGINDAERIDGFGLNAYDIHPGITDTEVTQKAIDYLCSDAVQKMNPKPVVLVHDKAIGTPIARTGCVSTVLTGRVYEATPPIRYADGTTEFISGSTGGHGFNEGMQIWGIIKNPATFHEIELDQKTNEVLRYDTITISNESDADVSISPTIEFPTILAAGPRFHGEKSDSANHNTTADAARSVVQNR